MQNSCIGVVFVLGNSGENNTKVLAAYSTKRGQSVVVIDCKTFAVVDTTKKETIFFRKKFKQNILLQECHAMQF